MSGVVNTTHGGTYRFSGDKDEAAKEYERFQGCLLQLVDDESIVGNLEDQWVIFKNGWVYGLSAFTTEENARRFAQQIFRDEPNANYIIVQVQPEKHALSAMHLLASALSDVESLQMRAEKEAEEEEVTDE
jgi:hypothetical protein